MFIIKNYSAHVKLYAFVRRIRPHVNNVRDINVVIWYHRLGFFSVLLDYVGPNLQYKFIARSESLK